MWSAPDIKATPIHNEAILPGQFFPLRINCQVQPETRLLIALLESCWECLSKHTGMSHRRARRIVKEELDWVMDESEAPFSFAFTCLHLGLEPNVIRLGILKRIEQIR